MTRGGAIRSTMLVAAVLCAPCVAWAAETNADGAVVAMRTGDHPGYGRIVFDLPPGARADAAVRDGRVDVVFEGAGPPPARAGAVRNLLGASTTEHSLTLTVAAGVAARVSRLPGRLVVDLADPRGTAPADADAPAPVQPNTERPALPARRVLEVFPKPNAAGAPAPAPVRARAGAALVAPRGNQPGPAADASVPPPAPRPAPPTPAEAGPAARTAQARDQRRAERLPSEAPGGGSATPLPAAAARSRAAAGSSPGARQVAAEGATPVAVERGDDPARTIAEVAQPPLAGERAPARASDAAQPGAIAASRPDGRDDGPARIVLPFGPTTGAAAYRAAEFGIVVFDERKPIDLAPFRGDPRFGGATVQLLTSATMLRLPLDPRQRLGLSRRRDGWSIAVEAAGPAHDDAPGIGQIVVSGSLHLVAGASGGVVTVSDDATGATLLVGTQREGGQAVRLARRMPGFGLRATWQGVVVEPVTDALTMRSVADGFVVSADARALPLAPEDAETLTRLEAGGFSRRFEFGSGSTAALRGRMEQAVENVAAEPTRARLRGRLDVAAAMIGLGLGAEAQALMQVAAADDPRAADDPDAVGLAAIAAILAGRPDEASGIEDRRLDGADDVALLRAFRPVCCGAEGGDAAVFSAQLPLIRSLPAQLRKRLLPAALQAMALGGQHAAVLRMLPQPQDDAPMELSRALALDAAARAGGDAGAALAAYDKLVAGNDRLVRARAAWRAAELRLDTGRISPGQAADALESQVYAWREDARERDLRMRVAELRGRAGEWPKALSTLRESEKLWPDQAGPIRQRMRALFADAVAQDARAPLPPLKMVALIEENADLLPEGASGQRFAAELSDRLLALDLPGHARPVLERLVAAAPAGEAQAEIAARLAALLLRERDPAAALKALASSASPDLPTPLRERRAIVEARATAAQGDAARAIAALAGFESPVADDARARVLEQARDWPAALAALDRYASRVLPADGALNDAQAAVVLRLASAAAQAGDDATLERLRAGLGPRLPKGRFADLATILTGQRLGGVGDLPIVAQEVALARRLPDALKSWSGPVATR